MFGGFGILFYRGLEIFRVLSKGIYIIKRHLTVSLAFFMKNVLKQDISFEKPGRSQAIDVGG
jgi:hypothetical protein